MRLSMSFQRAAIVCLLATFSAPASVVGGLIYMSSDGAAAGFNLSRADSLGHTVFQDTLSTIVAASPATLLSDYDVVWVNPDLTSGNFSSLQTAVVPSGSLEQYVNSGGVLVLNVASRRTGTGAVTSGVTDIAPGGVDYDASQVDNSQNVLSPAHPYLTGVGYGGATLSSGSFATWLNTDHGWFTGLPLGATTILDNSFGGPTPTFVEYAYGSGTVILNSLTFGYGAGQATGAPLNNLIDYAVFASQDASATVPEPSSLAVLWVGFGLTTIHVVRKRRQQVAVDMRS